MTVEFFVKGLPVPAGSKKSFLNPKVRKPGFGSVICTGCGKFLGRIITTDQSGKRLKDWKRKVQDAALLAKLKCGGGVFKMPLFLNIVFLLPRPKAHYRSNGKLHDWAPDYPAKRPDTTKLLRGTEDALTGILVSDDALIVDQLVTKRYCSGDEEPGAAIAITEKPVSQLRVLELAKHGTLVRKSA